MNVWENTRILALLKNSVDLYSEQNEFSSALDAFFVKSAKKQSSPEYIGEKKNGPFMLHRDFLGFKLSAMTDHAWTFVMVSVTSPQQLNLLSSDL